jgi:hypothetical protein
VCALGLLVVIFAIYQAAQSKTKETPPLDSLVHSRVALRVSPRLISKIIPSEMLKIERIDNTSSNVWGWVISTNMAGRYYTQWFRCTFTSGMPVHSAPFGVKEIKMFPANPLGSQALANP